MNEDFLKELLIIKYSSQNLYFFISSTSCNVPKYLRFTSEKTEAQDISLFVWSCMSGKWLIQCLNPGLSSLYLCFLIQLKKNNSRAHRLGGRSCIRKIMYRINSWQTVSRVVAVVLITNEQAPTSTVSLGIHLSRIVTYLTVRNRNSKCESQEHLRTDPRCKLDPKSLARKTRSDPDISIGQDGQIL